jgi:hypothetical protein
LLWHCNRPGHAIHLTGSLWDRLHCNSAPWLPKTAPCVNTTHMPGGTNKEWTDKHKIEIQIALPPFEVWNRPDYLKALIELATKVNPEGHPDVFNEHFSSQFPKYGYLSVFSVA